MPWLTDIRTKQEFPLQGVLTVLGRDPACDIVADSPMVSARHLIFLRRSGLYSVEDLDSRNGTHVNGERLVRRARLFPGDQISVVGLTLEFHDEGTTEESAVARIARRAAPDALSGNTICLSDLQEARQVKELSSLPITGDLRLSVRPEAKLRAVLEIARHLSHTLDLDIVLPQILDSLFTVFPAADCGFILLRNALTGDLIPGATKYRRPEGYDTPPISRSILQQVLSSGRAILSQDAGSDERIRPTDSVRHLDIRSIMCVPILREDGDCMGLIQLDSRDFASQFNEEDLALLVCASLLAARAMEVARLHEERKELDAATRIQRSLLPCRSPDCPGLQFFQHYAPAAHVSGDYYDYITLPEDRLAIVVGDVAGKGLSASLLMSHLAAAARICLSLGAGPADAVRRLNQLLLESITDDRFITCVVAVLDANSGDVTIINAGHPPPLVRRGGDHDARVDIPGAETAGLPLGVTDRPYSEIRTRLDPGDTLLLYTDGVSETRNPRGELYGQTRLHHALLTAPGDAAGLGNALLEDLQQFSDHRRPGDDLTIVCLGRIH